MAEWPFGGRYDYIAGACGGSCLRVGTLVAMQGRI